MFVIIHVLDVSIPNLQVNQVRNIPRGTFEKSIEKNMTWLTWFPIANSFVHLIRNPHRVVILFSVVDMSYLYREGKPLELRFYGNHKYEGLVVLMGKLHKLRWSLLSPSTCSRRHSSWHWFARYLSQFAYRRFHRVCNILNVVNKWINIRKVM